jgi:hypothetical protein
MGTASSPYSAMVNGLPDDVDVSGLRWIERAGQDWIEKGVGCFCAEHA